MLDLNFCTLSPTYCSFDLYVSEMLACYSDALSVSGIRRSTFYNMDTTQAMGTLRITESFMDYGFWIRFEGSSSGNSTSENRARVDLYIGESKLGEGRRFISGIGQNTGAIVKVQVMASKCDHFFIVVNRDGTSYKYRLRKHHIMSPVPDQALEMKSRIPGLKALSSFWSKLAQDVVDSRKAVVAAATTMMATDPKWYMEGLAFVRRNQRWEDHQFLPASSEAARTELPPTKPSEDPLTAPYARCFAKVPFHPDFGLPRLVTRSTYTPGTLSFPSLFL